MAGEFWGYYNREGKGKKKRYICIFCNHKLPTLSGITSHLSRLHSQDILEDKRRTREWKENQQRKKQEAIEQRRVEKEFGEQQLEEYRRMLPQIKLQNRLEEEAKQRRIERNRRICNKMIEAHENGESWGNVLRIYQNYLIGKTI